MNFAYFPEKSLVVVAEKMAFIHAGTKYVKRFLQLFEILVHPNIYALYGNTSVFTSSLICLSVLSQQFHTSAEISAKYFEDMTSEIFQKSVCTMTLVENHSQFDNQQLKTSLLWLRSHMHKIFSVLCSVIKPPVVYRVLGFTFVVVFFYQTFMMTSVQMSWFSCRNINYDISYFMKWVFRNHPITSLLICLYNSFSINY